MAINKKIGLKNNARSPSSITNAEHHDPSNSKRVLEGLPSDIDFITNDGNEHAVRDNSILRVTNTTGAAIYAWTGEAEDSPTTVDSSNGVTILPGTSELIFIGYSEDSNKSRAYKLSAAEQVVVYNP